jgi:hypothetical protein
VFRGETLRGLLLNAYAFGTMGTIAGIAAIAAYIAAMVMLLLSSLGLAHARRVSPATEILTSNPARPHHPSPITEPAAYSTDHSPAGNGLVTARPGSTDSQPE